MTKLTMTNPRLSRRRLLEALGLSGAATFMPWLRPGRAQAAGIPTRLLVFWSGSGVPRQAYGIKAGGGGPATETDFVFPAVRDPLNAIRKDLIAFENLDMVSLTVDSTPALNAHFAAETHSLSGIGRADRETAGGPSLDQYVAQAINRPSPLTRIPSLALAARCDGNVSHLKVCTPRKGEVLSLEPNPRAAFGRVFDSFMPLAPTPIPGGAPSAAQLRSEQQKSVLDLVHGEYKMVRPLLARDDLHKLDAHTAALSDLEQRLRIGGMGGPVAMPGAACRVPPASLFEPTGNAYPGSPALYKANFEAMTRTVQAAFACDLTRVALLCVDEPLAPDWGYTNGAWGSADAHDLLHKTSFNAGGTLKNNPDAMRAVQTLHQLEARQFVGMLDLLRQIPEADGKTLLDHTIVLWCSQIGEHGHDVDQLPWIIGGGSAAGFAPGRYLRYPRVGGKGVPHNNLFVSIAQAMGVTTSSFGNPAVCTGPLDRLRL